MTGPQFEQGPTDPAEAAWVALAFQVDRVDPHWLTGNVHACGRCARERVVTPLLDVVSRNFTGWDLVRSSSMGMCQPCAWAFTGATLRTQPMLVSAAGAQVPTRALVVALLGTPVPETIALTLPVLGKKHLLPAARWGSVTSDQGPLGWGSAEANLFSCLLRAREAGCTEGDLAAAAPPFTLMRSGVGAAELFSIWECFGVWRSLPHWPVAVRASRLPTEVCP